MAVEGTEEEFAVRNMIGKNIILVEIGVDGFFLFSRQRNDFTFFLANCYLSPIVL